MKRFVRAVPYRSYPASMSVKSRVMHIPPAKRAVSYGSHPSRTSVRDPWQKYMTYSRIRCIRRSRKSSRSRTPDRSGSSQMWIRSVSTCGMVRRSAERFRFRFTAITLPSPSDRSPTYRSSTDILSTDRLPTDIARLQTDPLQIDRLL